MPAATYGMTLIKKKLHYFSFILSTYVSRIQPLFKQPWKEKDIHYKQYAYMVKTTLCIQPKKKQKKT